MVITARDAATEVRKKARAFVAEVEDAEHRTLAFAARLADKQSSGSVSQAKLNAQNNPYGFDVMGPRGPRGPIPYGDPGIVNAQSGKFKQGWQTRYGFFSGGQMMNSLINETPEAVFLEGTRLMIRRPILDRIASAVKPVRLANLREAFRRVNL